MPVRFVCPSCRKGVTAGDKFAGRVANCPGCGTPVDVPSAIDVNEYSDSRPSIQTLAPPPASERLGDRPLSEAVPAADLVDCEFCGEEIKANARKCKHCGEYLDEELRKEKRHAGSAGQTSITTPAEANPGIAALLSLIIPGAGQMYQNKVGQGIVWLVAVSIGYAMLIVPGLVLHVVCIVSAASSASRDDRLTQSVRLLVLSAVAMSIFAVMVAYVLSMDEEIVPGEPLQPEMPAAAE